MTKVIEIFLENGNILYAFDGDEEYREEDAEKFFKWAKKKYSMEVTESMYDERNGYYKDFPVYHIQNVQEFFELSPQTHIEIVFTDYLQSKIHLTSIKNIHLLKQAI